MGRGRCGDPVVEKNTVDTRALAAVSAKFWTFEKLIFLESAGLNLIAFVSVRGFSASLHLVALFSFVAFLLIIIWSRCSLFRSIDQPPNNR